ncbi:MAG: hypothetical protein KKG47_05210 [Proteobacteria bacterium]|nr:hypothetical protein [Pseudomonadota bacterium]MBU1739805.1 hypothetical protein [Pseudomonadota bacterium]
MGTSTVSIYGPSSPVSWAPVGPLHMVLQTDMECVPCRQKGCGNSGTRRCLDELTVEEVRSSAAKMLGELVANLS